MSQGPIGSGGSFLFYLPVLFALILATCTHATKPSYLMQFNRSSFPASFLFGSGSVAYQVCSITENPSPVAFVYAFQYEGAANEHGRGQSIWETFGKEHHEKIADQSAGDVAVDFYHRYKKDIKLMKKLGFDSFRFSISWTRILPKGKISGGVNQQGVQFYNNLINKLLANALEDEHGGFVSPKIVPDFVEYADFCFKTFWDRVKLWVTMNERNGWSINGYNSGSFAPGRCSGYVGNCSSGDCATEPYVVAHHLLLSHAAAVKLYKQKYQVILIVTNWYKPISNTATNRMATSRALDFFLGWFVRPITFGDYPKSMRSAVGSGLPKFSVPQSKMLKGSLDPLGVNYYITNYVENAPSSDKVNLSYTDNRRIKLTTERKRVSIGLPTALMWLFIYPKGLRELLFYIKENYSNPPIYITENGVADANNASLPIKDALKDNVRIRYLYGHLTYLLKAIKEGADVKAYYVWTFLDDFEWDAGHTVRFGLTYIDFKNNLKRYLKYSAYWLKMFLLK
ncbi:vicianin hydrolase-like [Herrania umbratica]|uniref:Vicianin hydrolase-like n=1 Tax=Herrania umbratica TaxID=108875 RepID=A0A6J1A1I7_9ROSI|nr:vicianin hydrolase-like [Herrania umbratica]